ncbi:hypothetical protein GCM10027168_31210 [Streptomyces capparidis]
MTASATPAPGPVSAAADTAPGQGFLILHGWQNHRPPGHWQHWLAGELTRLGHPVGYPQLPDADEPDLETWLAESVRHLDALRGRERVVLCHSLSVLVWLHLVARHPGRRLADRVLLVAPPSVAVTASYPEVAGFVPPRLTPADLAAAADTRLVAGDEDEYCAGGAAAHYGAPLGLDTDVVPGGGHLDLTAGYGSWPDVLAWCLDPGTRLGPRPAEG